MNIHASIIKDMASRPLVNSSEVYLSSSIPRKSPLVTNQQHVRHDVEKVNFMSLILPHLIQFPQPFILICLLLLHGLLGLPLHQQNLSPRVVIYICIVCFFFYVTTLHKSPKFPAYFVSLVIQYTAIPQHNIDCSSLHILLSSKIP